MDEEQVIYDKGKCILGGRFMRTLAVAEVICYPMKISVAGQPG